MSLSKAEIISHSVDKEYKQPLKLEKSYDWTTLIPIAIGAALALLSQGIAGIFRSLREKKRINQGLRSKATAKAFEISQNLNHLAMYKAHKKYYLQASQIEKGQESDKSHNKHYEKGQEQRKCETELTTRISEFIELIAEYQILNNTEGDIKTDIEKITKYDHPKPKTFTSITLSDLVKELNEEEKRLNMEYDHLRKIFTHLTNQMI